jgi:hypothetical protein
MVKAALVGALALATISTASVSAQEGYHQYGASAQASSRAHEGHVSRLRAVLRLTPEQRRYWPAVAAALRGYIRAQNGGGYAQRASSAYSAARVAAAARPLMARLTDQQKQAAMNLASSVGLSHLASSL